MAGGVSLPPRPERPWRHDWFSYEEYQVVHVSHMERLMQEGVVLRDALSFYETFERPTGELVAVTLKGRLQCSDDVTVRVDKRMLVRRGVANRHEVKTIHYQYHAWVRARPDRPRRNLLRYDTNSHRPELHAHLFDADGWEVGAQTISLEEMPTLDGFIRHVVTLASSK